MNELNICDNLKLLCIIPIQKLIGYHLKGICFKLLKDHQKLLSRITSYDLYITHLINYKYLLLKKIIEKCSVKKMLLVIITFRLFLL